MNPEDETRCTYKIKEHLYLDHEKEMVESSLGNGYVNLKVSELQNLDPALKDATILTLTKLVEKAQELIYVYKGFKVKIDQDIVSEKEVKFPDLFPEGKFKPLYMADHILSIYDIKTLVNPGDMFYYKEGVYKPGGEQLIETICSTVLGENFRSFYTHETIKYIKGLTYTDTKDPNPMLINMKNGLFNLETDQLMPHNPDLFIVTQIPVMFDKEAECPSFLKFLSEVIDEDDVPVVQEFFGYCLFRDYPVHKAIMCIGEGANGKSTLLNVLQAFLGKENTCSIALQTLNNNRFAVGDLYGKLANIYPDLSSGALQQSGVFKIITGGDVVGAEKKFGGRFSFINYAKQIFSCNELPETKDKSSAFFRRWIFIRFPNIFDDSNKDPRLLQKLITPGELSGIFNWAVRGLQRLLERGKFSYTKSTEETEEQYVRMSSPISAFVLDRVDIDLDAWISKEDLYQAFILYCKEMKVPTMPNNTFSRKLKEHGISLSEERRRVGGIKIRGWKGIKLKQQSGPGGPGGPG